MRENTTSYEGSFFSAKSVILTANRCPSLLSVRPKSQHKGTMIELLVALY